MTVAAVVGYPRLANFRLGYSPATLTTLRSTRVIATVDDVVVRYRIGSLTIRDSRNDNPNTAQFILSLDTRPEQGQTVRITVNADDPTLLFTGQIQTITDTYDLKPAQAAWLVRCQDDTPRANRRIPFGYFENESATSVAGALVRDFAPGFTANHVQDGLPQVTILFDGSEAGMNGCLRALVKAMGGGYFYWEDRDLHLFTDESTEVPDDIDSTPGRLLDMPKIQIEYDDSQIRTRVFGKGRGESVLSDVASSPSGTVVPLADTSYFADAGQAIVNGMILSYTSKLAGGTGSKIGGTSITPGTPSAAVSSGTAGNLAPGAYRYAITYVINGGETAAGNNSGAVTITQVSAPGSAPTMVASAGGSLTTDLFYQYAVTFVDAVGETTQGPPSTEVQITAGNNTASLSNIPTSGDGRVTSRKIYRRWITASGLVWGSWFFVSTIANNSSTTATDSAADSTINDNPAPPLVNTAGSGQIDVSSIAVGPTGTTARRLYRSPANIVSISGYKFLTTISNNTATTYTDNTADSGLGAQKAPDSSTVGPSPGDSTIPVQETEVFDNDGGWVYIGNQVVKYGGRSVSSGEGTLTGVPASGAGALVSTVAYNAVIENTPQLRGVTGLDRDLVRGDEVYIWVERNDTTAQAALATREGGDSDGIIEHKIEDQRRTAESLEQICDADLVQFGYPLITVTYATYDVKTKSGKPVRINLSEFDIDETLTIQDVTISDCEIAPGKRGPKFTAVASSARFTLEDLLRRMTDGLGGL